MRRLVFDTASGSVMIGSQTLTGSAPLTAPSQGGPATGGEIAAAQARVFLEQGAVVELGGRYQLFGTTNAERVMLESGTILLDPSFNRGGDVLVFDRDANDFTAVRQGSSVKLSGGGLEVVVPVGTVAMTLDFVGADDRQLLFDVALGEMRIGQQLITATPVVLSNFA